MNLSLIAIEVEAFKNFVECTTVDLSGLGPGLHFVRGINGTNDRMGSNGAGKSTLFSDATTWCLYGRTVGGLRTTDVRSWHVDQPARVAITLWSPSLEYVIQRGPRASDLTINGKTVGQEDVDALVGVSYAAWAQAIVWGQGQPLFLDLAPRDKMALLSDALGLERWERRAEAAALRAKRLEDALRSLDGELRGLETTRDHAQAALEEAKAAADIWGKDQAARLVRLKEAVEAAAKAEAAAEDERGNVDLDAESVALAIGRVRPVVEAAHAELRELDEASARLLRDLADNQRVFKEVAIQTKSFTEEGVCPLCKQTVTKKDAAAHVRELSERSKKLKKELDQLVKAAHQAKVDATEAREALAEDATEFLSLEARERQLAAALLSMTRRAAETRSAHLAAATALAAAEEERNPHRDAASAAKVRLREVNAALKEGDEKATKLEASAERAQFWAKGFREVRLMVIDEVLEDLRETTATVLEGLGLGEWEVDYSTERENKSGTFTRALVATVRAPGAPEGVRWEVYSGGEGQRLRLASALALGEVLLGHAGVHADFRIMDEPTRGLSREGVRDLTEMLADYAEAAGLKILYIDHQSSDGLVFASTLTVASGPEGATVQN